MAPKNKEQDVPVKKMNPVPLLLSMVFLLAAAFAILVFTTVDNKSGKTATNAPVENKNTAVVETIPFDAKTATQLPDGTTPAEAVKTYHNLVVAKKFTQAYKLLPLANQKNYGSPEAYAKQLEVYGITGYKLGKATETDDTYSVLATMETPQLEVNYIWNYRKVDGHWYVENRRNN